MLHSLKREWSSEQWYGKDDMLRWNTFKKFSLSGGFFNLLGLKYLVILKFCLLSAPRLICCRNWVFYRIRFWATFTNLIFLHFSVSIKFSSFSLENGKSSLVQTMQYHIDLSCLRYSYVRLFILLHLRCTQISHLSHWIESELLVGNIFYMESILPYQIL